MLITRVPQFTVLFWLSRGGSFYARTLLRLRQRDVTGGCRAFRTSALEAIRLGNVISQGYCFQIEMLWRANRAGLRIAEVPIIFTERRWGVSKMHGMIVLEANGAGHLGGHPSDIRCSSVDARDTEDPSRGKSPLIGNQGPC